jgi:hypothetical protein
MELKLCAPKFSSFSDLCLKHIHSPKIGYTPHTKYHYIAPGSDVLQNDRWVHVLPTELQRPNNGSPFLAIPDLEIRIWVPTVQLTRRHIPGDFGIHFLENITHKTTCLPETQLVGWLGHRIKCRGHPARKILLLCRVQTRSGVHPASIYSVPGALSSKMNWPLRETDSSPHVVLSLRLCGAIPPLPHISY